MITAGAEWDTLYDAAIEGVEVLPGVDDAIRWTNDFVQRIDRAGA